MSVWAVDVSSELVTRAAARDRLALEQLSAALMRPIYNLAMRFFGDPDDAADETQDALVHVLRVLPTFEGKSQFSTWCYRVVINRFLNARRRRQESMTVAIGAEALDEGLAFDAAQGPYSGTDAALLAEEVKLSCTSALLLCLSRPLRMAYILGEILALSAPEASLLLEIEPDAFRKRLSVARRKVRAFLEPRCGWIDRANACRCERQVGYDVAIGWIEPSRLKYLQDKRATEVAKDGLNRSFDEASLYRSHPHYASPARLRAALNDALDTLEELGRVVSERTDEPARK